MRTQGLRRAGQELSNNATFRSPERRLHLIGARGTLITPRGEILLDTEKWAPFTAEQTFEAHCCEFVWHARVKMAPLLTAIGGEGPMPPLNKLAAFEFAAELAERPLL